MAIQAALTGHLVFSTVHTNDSASTITRLADLGVPPYLITATVVGVLAQRLTRTLCPACKAPDPALTPQMLSDMAAPWRFTGSVMPHRAVGCLACRNTGYRGRAALYELMLISEAINAAIHPTLDTVRLRKAAIAEGLRPLRVAGLAKVAEGVTTLEEVLRCTPNWQAMA
jgi:general secretion pathway protein E